MTSSTEFDPERYVAAVAPALGLDLTAEQSAGAARFLQIAYGMARVVNAAPVDADAFYLAPVFRPGDRRA